MEAWGTGGPEGRGKCREWVISDTHFGHKNILRYCPSRAKLWGPEGRDAVREMDEDMIALWNETVGEGDIVYHLGDFALGADPKKVLARLKGRIWLLLGNHDTMGARYYMENGVEGLLPSAWPWSKEVIFSHAPLHPMSFAGRWKMNVHGHIHEHRVTRWRKLGPISFRREVDPRYICVAVEQTRFRPRSCNDFAALVQKI